MAADPNVVLDLDTTLDERKKVRIDGRLYCIRATEELSILGVKGAWARFGELSALLNIAKPSKKQGKALSTLLDELCRLVLEAPDTVHGKLKDSQRLQIVSVFSSLLPGVATAGAKPTPPRSARSTGMRRSRG